MATQPVYNTPLGKPVKRTTECPPLTVPDMPAVAPSEPVKVPMPV